MYQEKYLCNHPEQSKEVGGDYGNYVAFLQLLYKKNHQCLNSGFCRTSGGLCNWRDWCRADSFWCSVHLLILYTKVSTGSAEFKKAGSCVCSSLFKNSYPGLVQLLIQISSQTVHVCTSPGLYISTCFL